MVTCSDNYVGAIGAATLANALQRNSTLRELSLKGNELVNEGTRALCKAFEERQGAISSLDLGNNRYRHESCLAHDLQSAAPLLRMAVVAPSPLQSAAASLPRTSK